jgi:tRNA U34 2-thiouridine synthase MnmA/TrmU
MCAVAVVCYLATALRSRHFRRLIEKSLCLSVEILFTPLTMVFLLRSSRCQIICSDALLKQRRVGIIRQSSLRLLKSTTASQQVKWNSTSSHHHVDDNVVPSTRSSAAPHIPQQPRSSSDEQLAQSSARTRVAVAMSGGVDSSVAAYLLQQMSKSSHKSVDGSNGTSISVNKNSSNSSNNMTAPKEESIASLDIIGLHMSNWNALDEDSDENLTNTKSNRRRRGQKMLKRETVSHEKSSNQQQHQHQTTLSSAAADSRKSSSSTTFCQTSENEYNDAKSVAKHLDIPLHRVSFASEYWIQVFEPFIESLSSSSPSPSSSSSGDEHQQQHQQQQQGMTMPNPDYGCNTYIKFGAMKDYAIDKLHADYVATGHYAQLWHRDYLNNNNRTTLSSNESSSFAFHESMVEMSKSLEGRVLESIAGRPEEEWILNNNNLDAKTTTMTMQPSPPPMLLAGSDRSKDQTYFLSGVKGEAFRNVIFPLGHLAKQHHHQQSKSSDSHVVNSSDSTINNNNNEIIHNHQTVREIAQNAQIPTATKRDSMGICFIGKRNFGQFISQYLPEGHTTTHPGNFIDIDTGKVVGTHDGMARYTLGEGAKISGANVRYFVCGKGRRSSSAVTTQQQSEHANNNKENTVFVCNSTHHPSLYSDELFVDFDSFNWIGLGVGDAIGQDSSSSSGRYNHIPRPLVEGKSIRLLARVRHLQPLTSCTVTWDRRCSNTMMNNGSGSTRGYLVIRFDKAMRAITPGQIVALYAGADGLVCLGGGIIGGSGLSYLDRGLDVTNGLIHPSGNNDLSLRTTT